MWRATCTPGPFYNSISICHLLGNSQFQLREPWIISLTFTLDMISSLLATRFPLDVVASVVTVVVWLARWDSRTNPAPTMWKQSVTILSPGTHDQYKFTLHHNCNWITSSKGGTEFDQRFYEALIVKHMTPLSGPSWEEAFHQGSHVSSYILSS